MKNEAYKNIKDKVDEYELYELEKLSLNENKLNMRAFESELKYIYVINMPNGMNHICNNEVNSISESNLIHDIINNSKRTKI